MVHLNAFSEMSYVGGSSVLKRRCQEQACYASGACVEPACAPAAGKAAWPPSDHDHGACKDTSLVCSFLDVYDSAIVYGHYPAKDRLLNCWQVLEHTSFDTYTDLRVWESLGFSTDPRTAIVTHKKKLDEILPY